MPPLFRSVLELKYKSQLATTKLVTTEVFVNSLKVSFGSRSTGFSPLLTEAALVQQAQALHSESFPSFLKKHCFLLTLSRISPKVTPLPVRVALGGRRRRSTSCNRSFFPFRLVLSNCLHLFLVGVFGLVLFKLD